MVAQTQDCQLSTAGSEGSKYSNTLISQSPHPPPLDFILTILLDAHAPHFPLGMLQLFGKVVIECLPVANSDSRGPVVDASSRAKPHPKALQSFLK